MIFMLNNNCIKTTIEKKKTKLLPVMLVLRVGGSLAVAKHAATGFGNKDCII